MTNQPTPVIDDAALAEMERVLADSPCATFPMTTEEARVLCATVRALRAQVEKQDAIISAYENNDEEALAEAENL